MLNILNQELSLLFPNNIRLTFKREDQIHPFISGNKYRKLKYNLLAAKQDNKKLLLTFGGAFSNHIAAVAYAGKMNGLATVGVIRGDELVTKYLDNPTLRFAKENGMVFEFVSREQYRLKEDADFLAYLEHKYGNFYLLPEGGTNTLAVKGCEEILNDQDELFDYICCAVGTGGTISGLINSSKSNQKILGFPALKGTFLQDEIRIFASCENWELIHNYHFGGYGKVTKELITFINSFYDEHKIPLDPVYTGKMVFGIIDMIQNNYFTQNSKILIIHTGGLQGIAGMNAQLTKKNLPTIKHNE